MYVNKLKFIDGKYFQKKTVVKNKFCKDCKHFNKNGQFCKLFTSVDVVTGKEENVRAYEARTHYNMCGLGAVEFEALDKSKVVNDEYEEASVSNIVFNMRP